MAAREPGARGEVERRRFITRAHVEDAASAGRAITVSGRDTVTDEAAQRAADLGVRIERQSGGLTAQGSPTAGATTRTNSAQASSLAASSADLRALVRAAVIAELGVEPPGLDDVIDRVLTSRSL